MKAKVADLIAQNPKISLAQIGKELNLSEVEVLLNLPNECGKCVGGEKFSEVIADIENWGEVLFVKNTPSFIIEFKTKIPSGKNAQGYYNFGMNAKGEEEHGALAGHLKVDDIDKIFFVTQTFMGMLSKSVQFYDKNGEHIFKLYLARDEKRQILSDQEAKFESLKARI